MKNKTIIDILKGISSGEIKNETIFTDDTLDNIIKVENKELYFCYPDSELKVQVYHVIDLIENNTIFNEI